MQAVANQSIRQSSASSSSNANPVVKANSALGEPMGFQQFEQKLNQGERNKNAMKEVDEKARAESEQDNEVKAEDAAQPAAGFVVSDAYLAQLKQMLGGNPKAEGAAAKGGEGEATAQLLTSAGLPQRQVSVNLPTEMNAMPFKGAQVVDARTAQQVNQQLQGQLPQDLATVLAAKKEASSNQAELLQALKHQLADGPKSDLSSLALDRLIAATQTHSQNLHASVSPTMQLQSAAAEQATKMVPQQFQASVDITQADWGKDLVDQLRSRMQFSKTDHLQQAHVRLDPPELGKLDINLRLEGDKVSVHFTAAHPQLREALLANAERLRFDFDGGQLQLGDVSVSSGNQQQGQHSHSSLEGEDELVASNNRTIQHGGALAGSERDSSRFESMI
ncbi:flagellar hook-length control protein FliK [Photobacterium kagoshimensis]|uniref:flagellar hook-length control protein FliK n=1 Tax=Photobacterium kagoshimensis TaxID=2910242 RepID=UPI003D0969A4